MLQATSKQTLVYELLPDEARFYHAGASVREIYSV